MNYRACPNLVRLFLDQAARQGDKPFIWAKRHNAWQAWSWKQAEAEMRRIAAGLAGLGIRPGDRVALVAENRPEWVIADLAIMATGAIAVPAYVTNTVDDHRHILSNAGCAEIGRAHV